jgi:tetratricopeptide (TPR) repeat protein
LPTAPHARVIDTESWELTLQGRFLYNRRAEGDWQKAFESFERAIELDPANAAAWIGIAPLHWYLFDQGDQGFQAMEKALELDPSNPEALMRKTMYLYWTDQEEEALLFQQQALEAGPDNPFVLMMMSTFSEYAGDLDLALAYLRRAVAADPLHLFNLAGLSQLLITAGRLGEAEKYAMKAVELSPVSTVSNGALATVRLMQGRGKEVVELAQLLPGDFVEHTSGIPRLLMSAMGYHTMGDQARADAALQEFQERAGERIPVDVAMIHAWRGETDEAFQWIERALTKNPNLEVDFFRQPFWGKVHDDPRWAEVMARLEED